MMIFSSRVSFKGLVMTNFMPDQYRYDAGTTDVGHTDDGHDVGHGDYGSVYFCHSDGGQSHMGCFDVNF
ncbi:MAG: hypothetical protein WCC52_08765 [Nitrosotalea sp.]